MTTKWSLHHTDWAVPHRIDSESQSFYFQINPSSSILSRRTRRNAGSNRLLWRNAHHCYTALHLNIICQGCKKKKTTWLLKENCFRLERFYRIKLNQIESCHFKLYRDQIGFYWTIVSLTERPRDKFINFIKWQETHCTVPSQTLPCRIVS